MGIAEIRIASVQRPGKLLDVRNDYELPWPVCRVDWNTFVWELITKHGLNYCFGWLVWVGSCVKMGVKPCLTKQKGSYVGFTNYNKRREMWDVYIYIVHMYNQINQMLGLFEQGWFTPTQLQLSWGKYTKMMINHQISGFTLLRQTHVETLNW